MLFLWERPKGPDDWTHTLWTMTSNFLSFYTQNFKFTLIYKHINDNFDNFITHKQKITTKNLNKLPLLVTAIIFDVDMMMLSKKQEKKSLLNKWKSYFEFLVSAAMIFHINLQLCCKKNESFMTFVFFFFIISWYKTTSKHRPKKSTPTSSSWLSLLFSLSHSWTKTYHWWSSWLINLFHEQNVITCFGWVLVKKFHDYVALMLFFYVFYIIRGLNITFFRWC